RPLRPQDRSRAPRLHPRREEVRKPRHAGRAYARGRGRGAEVAGAARLARFAILNAPARAAHSMSDAPDTTELKRDYRPTVFLPKTDFPMKAGLPQKEPVIAARWKNEDLYGQVRKARAGREKFI